MGRRTSTSSSLHQPLEGGVGIVAAPGAAGRLAQAIEAECLRVTVRVSEPERLAEAGADPPTAVVLQGPDLGRDLVARARTVRRLLPEARLVVVAPAGDLRRLRDLFTERVDALVLDGDVERCLGLAVRSACQGLLSFSQSLRATLARPVLTTREKQVLAMVVLGLSNEEIARRLHVSQSTVKSHLSSSFTKLGVRSRSEAAALILDPQTGLGTGILAISDDG
jgi:DNA-binding NarL/FixJ family response regulator